MTIDMKTIKNIMIVISSLLLCAACEKDGDKIYLSSPEGGKLIATDTEVTLTTETSSQVVFSLAWTKSALQVSDASMSAPDVQTTIMQVAATEDFSGDVVESVEASLSKAYVGKDLNATAKKLGVEPEVPATLYFRLKASVANNIEPVYSNVLSVRVVTYAIDMSVAYILNSDKKDTGVTLYSKDVDGDYAGFMGIAAWYNYFLREGDETIWGNLGIDNSAFLLSSDDSKWNFWFPGHSGCYYVDVNTNKKVWSALYIPSVTVSGDVAGEMAFDRSNVKWTLPFNAAQAGNITLKAAATGRLYDYSTGTEKSDTDENPGIETPVGFVQSGENLIFGKQASDITVNVPAAGECTLVIDLSNPKQWTVEVTSGGDEPEPVRETLYMLGISEGEGDWNFNNYLRLYNEDNLGYAGVADVNSPWGYQIAIEEDNWSDVYKLGEGDANAGTLVLAAENNIPAPGGGLYFFDVSLKALTYKLRAIGSEIYVAGLNKLEDEDWTFEPLPAATTSGVFSGSITITQPSDWGFKIYLFDGNWDYVYGGSAGKLYYKSNNGITDDATLAPGTYTLTVDLINATYTIE